MTKKNNLIKLGDAISQLLSQEKLDIKNFKDKPLNSPPSAIISIDSNHRGKGYAKEILMLSTDSFLKFNQGFLINAYIKEGNLSSKLAFENAGFIFIGMIEYEYARSFHFIKK